MLKETLPHKIKKLRKEKKLTQEFISDVLGCDVAFISKCERGKSFYNLEHIEKICAALNYPVWKLFEDEPYQQEEQSPQGQIEYDDPVEEALIKMFRGLSPKDRGDLIGKAEELKIKDLRKKVNAAQS